MNARISSDGAAGVATAAVGLIQTPTRYTLIHVADNAFSGALNGAGQVALYQRSEDDRRIAAFYDGQTLTSLGTLGGRHSEAVALNARGQVVGRSNYDDSDFFHAFRWSRQTGMVDLGALPGHPESAATDINNAGEVTGYSGINGSDEMRAVRWAPNGAILNLGTLAGPSIGIRINDAGRIAGGYSRAFSWTESQGLVDISPPGAVWSTASDMNASGQIAGTYGNGLPDPFLWTPASGPLDLGDNGNSVAINDAGMVVGITFLTQTAFAWTPQGGRVEFGNIPGASFTAPMDVNNQGQVVGLAAVDYTYAFLWTAAEGLVDLNTRLLNAPPGLRLTYAVQVNDRGQILAVGSDNAVYLLNPGPGGAGVPLISPIQAAPIGRIGTPLAFNAGFKGAAGAASQQAEWSRGDGTSSMGRVDEENGNVTGEHTYSAPGMYTVQLTLTDSAGRRASARRTVIAAGASGFTAAQGGFLSPPGAAKAAPAQLGPASFALLAEGTGPDGRPGSAEFRFSFMDLEFRGSAAGLHAGAGPRIEYRGQGALGGRAGYRFQLVLVNYPPARVRIRIWREAAAGATELVVYDNDAALTATDLESEGTVLSEGAILT